MSIMKHERFSELFREARKRRGITPRQLADAVGVNHTYLNHIESGRIAAPSEQMIAACARIMRADGWELMRAVGIIPHAVRAKVLALDVAEWRALTGTEHWDDHLPPIAKQVR